MQYRKFGNTGVSVSALGFGCMRLPVLEDHSVDEAEAISIIRHAIDEGVNYIDTAYPYHDGKSEIIVGKALRDGYREKVNLATKLPLWAVDGEADFDRILNEQLQKLQTDHIDFYLLHAVGRERMEQRVKPFHLIDHMRQAKADGRIRHIGFSFHDSLAVFKEIVDYTDAWEFCQIQYNYININDQAGTEGMRYAASKGLGIIVMEPLLGGRLARLSNHVAAAFPPGKTPVEYALDFLWNQPEVGVVLSGMGSRQQVDDNLLYASRSGVGMLSEEDTAVYAKVKEIYDSMSMVGCTGCAYCMPCPFGLNIPEIFKVYNGYGVHGSRNRMREAYGAFENGPEQCHSCHKCEQICPQHIKVSQVMKDIAGLVR